LQEIKEKYVSMDSTSGIFMEREELRGDLERLRERERLERL